MINNHIFHIGSLKESNEIGSDKIRERRHYRTMSLALFIPHLDRIRSEDAAVETLADTADREIGAHARRYSAS